MVTHETPRKRRSEGGLGSFILAKAKVLLLSIIYRGALILRLKEDVGMRLVPEVVKFFRGWGGC